MTTNIITIMEEQIRRVTIKKTRIRKKRAKERKQFQVAIAIPSKAAKNKII